jgi:hypothetical protein
MKDASMTVGDGRVMGSEVRVGRRLKGRSRSGWIAG